MKVKIYPLKAFNDNYIWIIQEGENVLVVDPGDAQPVLNHLKEKALYLKGILITHHHADHTGGITTLLEHYKVPVYGPALEEIPKMTHPLTEQDEISPEGLSLNFSILELPGHTLGHIAYVCHPKEDLPALFCGDTLFASGCGRLFEGNSRQMLQSIDKITKLSGDTRVFCAHEYTLSNIAWAQKVEPNNIKLQEWAQKAHKLRQQDTPTIPTQLKHELEVNPFLRVRQPNVQKAAAVYANRTLDSDEQVFAALREWKNNF